MGFTHDHDGFGNKQRRVTRLPFPPGPSGSWFVPGKQGGTLVLNQPLIGLGCQLLSVMLVQAIGARYPRGHVLLRCSTRWIIRRTARCRNCVDGRNWWKVRLTSGSSLKSGVRSQADLFFSLQTWLGLDLHYRRTCYYVRGYFLLVDGFRLARYCRTSRHLSCMKSRADLSIAILDSRGATPSPKTSRRRQSILHR